MAFAKRAPIGGTREQKQQALRPAQGLEGLRLPARVVHLESRDQIADLGAAVEGGLLAVGCLNRQSGEDTNPNNEGRRPGESRDVESFQSGPRLSFLILRRLDALTVAHAAYFESARCEKYGR